jgi:hypothetical protein
VFHMILTTHAISLTTLHSSLLQLRQTVLSVAETEFLYNIYINFRVQRAVPWLRQSDTGLSPGKPRFNPGLVHVRLVVYNVALGQQVVSTCFGFHLSLSLHQRSTLTISILPLSERQAGETWETSNKVMLFWISGRNGQKSTFIFYCRLQRFRNQSVWVLFVSIIRANVRNDH